MDGDPYARFVALSREQGPRDGGGLGSAPARMRLGTVKSITPLQVEVAGTLQPAKALRVNERLVKGARWRVRLTSLEGSFHGLTGPIQGPVDTPHGAGALSSLTGGQLSSTQAVLEQAQAEQLEIDVEPGDRVLLLTEDDQSFFLIMKVVDAV